MKLLAYVRVSEESENPENQVYAIYEFTSRNGHQVIDVIRDIGISGALPPKERPGFSKVLEELNKADGIIVYALDRIARSLIELVDVVKAIEDRGKVVLSVREPWLQQLDPKVRTLILAVLGWAAEMEREFIRERTREALKRLKAQGKRIGRPQKVTDQIALEAIKYIERGYKLKDVAKILGVGYSTLAKKLTQDMNLSKMYYEAKIKARIKVRK